MIIIHSEIFRIGGKLFSNGPIELEANYFQMDPSTKPVKRIKHTLLFIYVYIYICIYLSLSISLSLFLLLMISFEYTIIFSIGVYRSRGLRLTCDSVQDGHVLRVDWGNPAIPSLFTICVVAASRADKTHQHLPMACWAILNETLRFYIEVNSLWITRRPRLAIPSIGCMDYSP
jgi:hypothetical protein